MKKKDEKNIIGHLDRIRKLARINSKAKIVSETNFPVAAGLASSASGLAALTLAATRASGITMDDKELTILTRMGSGSACRSICEGFAMWHRGNKEDGSDSFAETIAGKNHWPEFRMITTIVTESKKKVSSRSGMAQSVKTSPYYRGWLDSVDDDLTKVADGIKRKDFQTVGLAAEANCLKMHALMLTTKPAIIYWHPATVEIIRAVTQWREEGLPCYFTIDAGPNVKVICASMNEKEITKRLQSLDGIKKTISCKPGDGAKLVQKHLF